MSVGLIFLLTVFVSPILNSNQMIVFITNCSTNSSVSLIDPLTVDIKTLHADLSSLDLVRWYLDRIAMLNDQGAAHSLHAIVETNPDIFEIANNVLNFGRQINGSRSILHEIQILVKDSIGTNDKMCMIDFIWIHSN